MPPGGKRKNLQSCVSNLDQKVVPPSTLKFIVYLFNGEPKGTRNNTSYANMGVVLVMGSVCNGGTHIQCADLLLQPFMKQNGEGIIPKQTRGGNRAVTTKKRSYGILKNKRAHQYSFSLPH